MQQTADIKNEQPDTGKKPYKLSCRANRFAGMQRPYPGRKSFAQSKPGRVAYFLDLTAPAIYPDRGVRMPPVNFATLPQIDAIDSAVTGRRGDTPEFGLGKRTARDKFRLLQADRTIVRNRRANDITPGFTVLHTG